MVVYEIDINVSEPLSSIRRLILEQANEKLARERQRSGAEERGNRAEALEYATWQFGKTLEFKTMADGLPKPEIPNTEKLFWLAEDRKSIVVPQTFGHARCGFTYLLECYEKGHEEDDYPERALEALQTIYERGFEIAPKMIKALVNLSTSVELGRGDEEFEYSDEKESFVCKSLRPELAGAYPQSGNNQGNEDNDNDYWEFPEKDWFELSADQTSIAVRLNDCGAPGFRFLDSERKLCGDNLIAIERCLRLMYRHGLDFDRPLIYPIAEIASEIHGEHLGDW